MRRVVVAVIFLLFTLQIFVNSVKVVSSKYHANTKFERIFIIMLENNGYYTVHENEYFDSLSRRGVDLSFFMAVTHPSQPNYWAQTAGNTFYNDDDPHDLDVKNIIDLFEQKGITWKAYQENYPGNCFAGTKTPDGLYYRKHNPFISFNNVRNNTSRCAKIVDASQLDDDINKGKLPQYSYYTPNMNNDAHDTNVSFAANWLKGFLEPKLSNPKFTSNALIVVTFDEDDYMEFNHIYTVLLGPLVTAGTVDPGYYTHYSLLKSVEDNWKLQSLTNNDKQADSFLRNIHS